jgi:hypothetical protein
LLRYWHLLSLDAPTVAALWCWAFGRAARIRLAPWLPLALAMGTWLFYVADRLLDARLSPEAALKERHRFHDRYRRWFLATTAPVALVLALLVARMPQSLITSYCVLGALSLLYLGLCTCRLARVAGRFLTFPFLTSRRSSPSRCCLRLHRLCPGGTRRGTALRGCPGTIRC